MPYSSSDKLTQADPLCNSTWALINFPVDLTFTKISLSSSSLLSDKKFSFFNSIFFFTSSFFGPTIISFFFASIFKT